MTQLLSMLRILFVSLNYLSLKKIQNIIRIGISYLFSRKKLLFYKQIRPFFMSIEPADFCQLECPECPVGVSKRKQGKVIDFNAFTKTVDELKATLFHLIFYFQGEPLLNKKLPEMIAYAHQSGIFTSTSTNGQLLNTLTAKALVESGLDKLIVSVDGTSQKTYQKYRKGGRLELALQGIENINYWKRELKSKSPFVEIQMVVFKTNEHEIDEMKTIAKNLNVNRLALKSAQLYNFENGHELLTTIDQYARYKMLPNGKYALKNKLHNRCFRLWSGAVVTAKGDVLPCCFDKDASHSFGNTIDNNFNDIIQNQNANSFRTSILENRKQHEMCRNCTSK